MRISRNIGKIQYTLVRSDQIGRPPTDLLYQRRRHHSNFWRSGSFYSKSVLYYSTGIYIEAAGYSPSYLTTLLRKKTGYSPSSYFSHLKITKACEYLDFSKVKIKEISFLIGYSDPYYFSKDFQKKMGISPRNYRKRVAGT